MYLKIINNRKIVFLRYNIQAFSLLEILMVLALFSSIVTLSLGTLLNVRSINAKLQQKEAVLDNLNFSLQITTKDIRFGSIFYCAQSLPVSIPLLRKDCSYEEGGGSVLIFKPSEFASSTDRVAYYVNNGVFYKDEYIAGGTTTLQITSDEVTVDRLTFFVNGALTSDPADGLNEGGLFDYDQPLVTIVISGLINNLSTGTSSSRFNLQTSVSSRVLDNK